jgi:parallel beta-helix repeat protein
MVQERIDIRKTGGGQITVNYGPGLAHSVKAPQNVFRFYRTPDGAVRIFIDNVLHFERALPDVYVLREDRGDTDFTQASESNYDDLTEDINGKGGGGAAGESKALRAARIVIGNAGAGYTEADCDLLCDGTNDLAQFNAALASLPTAGGEIKVLDGTYVFASPLVIGKSNVRLSGSGAGNTTLLMTGIRISGNDATSARTSNAVIYVSGSSNVIEGFTLTTPSNTDGTSFGVYIHEDGTNNTVTGNSCSNFGFGSSANPGGGIFVAGYGNTVTGNTCTCKGGYNAGIFLKSATDNCVTGNRCSIHSNYHHSYGIYLANSRSNTVSENTVTGASNGTQNYGIFITGGGNNAVTGNGISCTQTYGSCYGIYLSGTGNNTVTGNTLSNTGMGTGNTVGMSYGVYLAASNNNTVAGNTLSNTSNGGTNGNRNTGIYLDGSSSNAVTGNLCSNSSTGGNYSSSYGIYLYNGSNNNTVTGNTCSNISGLSYGMEINASNNNTITGNTISSVGTNTNAVSFCMSFLNGCCNNTVSFVAAGKTASFTGMALYINGTANEYNRIVNCNLRNWAQYGMGVLTTDAGATAAALPGSAMAVEDFSAIGAGSVAGLNTV